MQRPKAVVGEFILLEVVALNDFGAFLACEGDKDLLLPTSEQTEELKIGDEIIVAIRKDSQDRPFASMRLENHLNVAALDQYKENQEVDLLIYRRTDLGYKAIVDNRLSGVLYNDQVFKTLQYGQRLKGFILKIRPDKKIDLSLQQTGHLAAIGIEPKILELLNKEGGFLALNEKTPPETIYKLFGVSKKKYKIVLGGLYKRKMITIHEDGIRLTQPPQK